MKAALGALAALTLATAAQAEPAPVWWVDITQDTAAKACQQTEMATAFRLTRRDMVKLSMDGQRPQIRIDAFKDHGELVLRVILTADGVKPWADYYTQSRATCMATYQADRLEVAGLQHGRNLPRHEAQVDATHLFYAED